MGNAADLVFELNSFLSKDDIASFFKVNNVKGYCQDETSCPISNWMKRNLDTDYLDVSTEDVIRVYNWMDHDNEVEVFETSAVVKEFIASFDEGEYPDLMLDWEDENWF